MPHVTEAVELGSETDAVWARIGQFDRFDWHPAVERMQASGARRTLFLTGGGELVEERTDTGADLRSYSYIAISGPLPVADYRATLRVAPVGGKRCQVTWEARFNAVGMDDEAADAVIRGVLRAGLDALPSLLA